MDQKNFFINMGAILATLCILSMVGNVAASNVTLYVGGGGDFYVDYGTTSITIPINANITGDSLGAMTLDISVNYSVLIPDSTHFVSSGSCSMDSGTLDLQNKTNGRSEFGITCLDVSGDFTMVTLNYTINSSVCGVKSYINLQPYGYVSNYNGDLISYITKNGSVTIKCDNCNCPSGTTCNTTTHLCQPIPKTCYGDKDGDGYGNATNTTTTTNANCPSGYVNNSQDCDDSNSSIHPGVNESIYGINGVDDNCDGTVDDCSPVNSSINAQIYCNASGIMNYKKNFNETCSANYECLSGSCNSTSGKCEGYVYYKDADNDGFGDSFNASNRYISLTDNGTTINYSGFNYTKIGGDCNDANASINPNAADIPNNGIDENCNGYDNITCYADLDNDNYTNNTNVVYSDNGCPANYKNASTTQDCDDSNSTINPGVDESIYGVNGVDNNCNGIVDDCSPVNSSINAQIYCNASGIMNYKKNFNETCSADYECLSGNCTNGHCAGFLCYKDADNDGFGNVSNYVVSNNVTCPAGYVNNSQDCNDSNSAINPNTKWYADNDSDGYGNNATYTISCTRPSGNWVLNNKDCDDNNYHVNPGMKEKKGWFYIITINNTNITKYTDSDGIDNDCDGIVDEECDKSSDCGSGHYCSGHECYKRSTGGGGTRVIDFTTPELQEFNVSIPNEIIGTTTTLNLGKEAGYANVVVTVGNKTSKSKANVNGIVTINLPGYGEGGITVSKSGYKDLTKTINVYAGALNITKVSGEKYGDVFTFRVTDNNGNPVKGATVKIYGKTLKTDEKGIVKTTIKTIQQGLKASASLNNYKGSSISFDVEAKGTLKINIPENVTKGDTITITITDENNNPVPDATVTINGVKQKSDKNGKIEYKVTEDSLTLKASKEGYIPSGQISVAVKEKIECGNGKCEPGETKENCPQDCIICGDNVCDKGENYTNCPKDCPKPSNNTLPIIIGVLIIVIVLIIAYYLMRKKKE